MGGIWEEGEETSWENRGEGNEMKMEQGGRGRDGGGEELGE